MENLQLTLWTERLQLRPFESSDSPRVQELAGDIAIADKTLNIPHPYEDGMAEEWISTHQSQYETGELANWAMILQSEKLLIGAIGLTFNQRFKRAELGYWLGKSYWSQGYCTEAARAVVNYGFDQLKLNKIVGMHFARNPVSGKIMVKVGMKKEGVLREHVIRWDNFEDLVCYGILEKEWHAGSLMKTGQG